ncbi:uncharacterized protein PG986_001891 [Apiospora aurea]|uniref:Fungal N-terminal domain-containing protein n=1 Tax=Apiospora aurea TaxID=335848 RepID=A0ABR1QY99_9PEZI
MAATAVIKGLDKLGSLVWNVDSDYDTLHEKVSVISAQIAVHKVLETTVRHLRSDALTQTVQSRLSKFLETVHGPEEAKGRFENLRNLDCQTFIFVAISFTPLDITKMNRTEFKYLIDNAAKFIRLKAPSQKWMFRDEIQLAIAAKASLKSTINFRKAYHHLEFQDDEDEPPPKRSRSEKTPPPNGQLDLETAEPLIDEQAVTLETRLTPFATEARPQICGDTIELTKQDVQMIMGTNHVIGKIHLIDTYAGTVAPFVTISVSDEAANHFAKKYRMLSG